MRQHIVRWKTRNLEIICRDSSLCGATISTTLFGKLCFNGILESLDFVIPIYYPARGDA